jgi:hypothetical protein
MVCEAKRIWSHLLLFGLRERLPDFVSPHRTRGRAFPILSMPRPRLGVALSTRSPDLPAPHSNYLQQRSRLAFSATC